jgi:outer membrane protein assembly factor BamA
MRCLLAVAGMLFLVASVSAQTPEPESRKTLVSRDPKVPLPAPAVKEPAAPVEDEDDDVPDCGTENVTRIRFIGNTAGFSDEELLAEMRSFQRVRQSAGLNNYCEWAFESKDQPRLEAFFKRKGFPETEIEIPKEPKPAPGELIVRVHVRRSCVIGNVQAFGVVSIPYDKVVGVLTPGQTAIVKDFDGLESAREAKFTKTATIAEEGLRKLYKQFGFSNAYVFVLSSFQNQTTTNETEIVDFEIFVEERPVGTVRTVEFTGNSVSRDYIIRRELLIGEGEPFCRALLDRSLENIRRLGLFSEVAVKEIRIDREKGLVDMTISVVDTPETIRKANAEQEKEP